MHISPCSTPDQATGMLDGGQEVIARRHTERLVTSIHLHLDPARGGGAFHDLNRYPLSAALHFLQGRQHTMLYGSRRERGGLNTAMTAETITDVGERFSFEIAFGQPYRSFYLITGERGTIRVERAFTTPPDRESRAASMKHNRGAEIMW